VDHDVHQGLLDALMGAGRALLRPAGTRLTCRDMVHGLLAELEDHNCWTIAKAAGHPAPHRMQHLLSRARVDEQQMLDAAAGWAAGHLSAGQDASDVVGLRHLRALTGAIGAAELDIEDWLGPRDLAEVVRTADDPHAQARLDIGRAAARSSAYRGEPVRGLPPGVAPALAGPAYAEAKPGVYLHDGAASVTYWVHEWPRGQVYCTSLASLLAEGSHRRSFCMIIEPLGPRQAEREVMRERTARHVAIRMRQRTGQIVPEHEQAAAVKARAQDAERAAGHGLVRFTAYVTVTAADADRIEDACAALEADAAAARIEVRRMWFAQDAGFAVGALPLGLGLPRRRW
jgi:hypothetical protein